MTELKVTLQRGGVAVVTPLALLAILASACGSPSKPASIGPNLGQTAPDLTLNDTSGKQVSLGQFRGRPTILSFLRADCPPCLEQITYLAEAYQRHRDRSLGVVVVIAGEGLESRERAETVARAPFPVLLDRDSKVSRSLYQVAESPATFFLSADGTIQYLQVGGMSPPQLEQLAVHLIELQR